MGKRIEQRSSGSIGPNDKLYNYLAQQMRRKLLEIAGGNRKLSQELQLELAKEAVKPDQHAELERMENEDPIRFGQLIGAIALQHPDFFEAWIKEKEQLHKK